MYEALSFMRNRSESNSASRLCIYGPKAKGLFSRSLIKLSYRRTLLTKSHRIDRVLHIADVYCLRPVDCDFLINFILKD